MLELYKEVIHLPDIDTPLATRIADDDKYRPYFSDCIGALDGTHIDVHVTPVDQPRYRNRKGHLSQNVLAVCDFDMKFTYVLAGWEGSAHDTAVWRDAKLHNGFTTPPGKYWLLGCWLRKYRHNSSPISRDKISPERAEIVKAETRDCKGAFQPTTRSAT